VAWLHERGAEIVILLGNSGGGPLLAAYQAQSRRPVVAAANGLRLASGLEDLPGADLYISLAAHPSRAEVLTNWLDPGVTNEQDPVPTDPALDMYNPDNGPPYRSAFVDRYRGAQRERNHRISKWCLRELERLSGGGYPDRLFTVARTWADLRFTDGSLDPSSRPTPACYRGDPRRANRGTDGIGMVSSLRTWLAMWSLGHGQCDARETLQSIDLPALVIQAEADAGVFPSDAKAIFDRLGSNDKRLVELPGDHYFRTSKADSSAPGPRETVADLIASWVKERT
jgi:pimeloyl-ACP methyl ester carboxylesterase